MQGMKRVYMYSAVPSFFTITKYMYCASHRALQGVFVLSFNSLHTTSATYNCNILPLDAGPDVKISKKWEHCSLISDIRARIHTRARRIHISGIEILTIRARIHIRTRGMTWNIHTRSNVYCRRIELPFTFKTKRSNMQFEAV